MVISPHRFFSRCGLIMRPHRRLMDPSTLEMLVMLRFNRDLWDERDVDTVIARNYDNDTMMILRSDDAVNLRYYNILLF